jgi:hypothetical protein
MVAADDRLGTELALVRQRYGVLEIGPGDAWFVVAHFPVPPGWNKTETPLLVLIPGGYPVTPPDNFYVANDLRLEGGGEPGNASANQAQANRIWKMFSWHLDDGWQPNRDPRIGHNLVTFCLSVSARLSELN